MYGLIGTGRAYKEEALRGLDQVAGLEQQRDIANEQLEQQEKQARTNTVATGAGIGLAVGAAAGGGSGAAGGAAAASWGGPIGAVIGAGIGLLASEFL